MPLVTLAARVSLAGVSAVEAGLKAIRGEFKKTAEEAKEAGGKLKEFGLSLLDVGKNATLAGTAVGAGLGVFAFQTASQMDSLTRGMASVSNNAEDLQGQMSKLHQIAALPGLSFEQAVQGALNLESVGLSAELSQRALMSFGNALASVGKGSGELDGVITALSQIVSKGVVSAEEINQLAERVPQIRRLLKDAFGTADTQEIQKLGIPATKAIEMIVSAAEKLPKVSGGIGNILENLGDKAKSAFTPLGQGIAAMLEGASPSIEKFFDGLQSRFEQVGQVLAAVGKSGVLDEIGSTLLAAFDKVAANQQGLIGVAANVLAVINNIPSALEKTGTYLHDLFTAITNNISGAFELVGRNITLIGTKVSTVLAGAMVAIDKAKALDFNGAAEAITNTQTSLKGLDMASSAMPDIKLQSLPTAPFGGIWDSVKGDASRFSQMIAAKMGPLTTENLNYGGRYVASEGGAKSQADPIDALLAKIEKNTGKAADELSLRRQSLGGGELARIGVTATEVGGFGGSGMAPGKGDYGNMPANSQLEKLLRNVIQQELAKRNGMTRVR